MLNFSDYFLPIINIKNLIIRSHLVDKAFSILAFYCKDGGTECKSVQIHARDECNVYRYIKLIKYLFFRVQ